MRRGTRSALHFFVLGFCTCLALIGFIRFLMHVETVLPLALPFHQDPVDIVDTAVYKLGDCPDCLKISKKYWKVDKLNDDNNVHLEAARRMGIKPFMTNADFEMYKNEMLVQKKLVELKNSDTYALKDLTHSYPFIVPKAVVLLDEIGTRFEAKLQQLDIAPHIMQISSVLRTIESQNGLGKRNSNAAPESAHMYGTTFDISYKEFLSINGTKVKEGFCRHDLMRHVLAEVLTEMRNEERCKVVIEKKQACFHITVN